MKCHLHFNFCCLEFNRLGLFFLIGLKWANTCINCRKLTLSFPLSSKKAFTILSPSGFIANSGILRKSSRLSVPQSPRSRLVKRLYNRSIWFGVTVANAENKDLHPAVSRPKFFARMNDRRCVALKLIRTEWTIWILTASNFLDLGYLFLA